MAAAKDTPTEVIEGADGTYRIGRVTEIIAPVVDATLEHQVKDAGIGIDDFRAALRRDVRAASSSDAIVAAVPRRPARSATCPRSSCRRARARAARARSGSATSSTRPTATQRATHRRGRDDPAWAAAEAKAEATYAKLKADPTLFDSIARAESNEGVRGTSGGKLPYFSADDPIDPAFAAAISAAGPPAGPAPRARQVPFGWHVIQVMHFPTDAEWAAKLKTDIDAGTLSFADAARDNSDKAEAADGRRVGWVAKGQLDRGARGRDLRRADRQGQRPAHRRGRGHLPVPRDQGGDPGARRGRRRRRSRTRRSRDLVLRAEGQLRRSPGTPAITGATELTPAGAGRRCWTRSSPRPASAGASTRRRAGRRRRRAARGHAHRAVAPDARGPGRPAPRATLPADAPRRRSPAGTAGRRAIRSRSCAASTRRTTRSAGSAIPRARRSASCTADDLAAPLYLAPVAPVADAASPVGDALDLRPPPGAGRLPLGPRADARVAAEPPAGGGLRGLRRARRRRHPGAGRRAGRPPAPGGPPRAARRGGRACST